MSEIEANTDKEIWRGPDCRLSLMLGALTFSEPKFPSPVPLIHQRLMPCR